MAKRNRVGNNAGMNTAGTAAATPNTATEFAGETNVAEVRRQNQKSAARAAGQNNNPNA